MLQKRFSMFSLALLLTTSLGSIALAAPPQPRNDRPDTCYDVSPDGLMTRGICPDQPAMGWRALASTVPYGTAPDWQNTVRCQVANVKAADVDGDGDIDVVVGCYTSNSFPP